jgi:single-strand DNA-binding protein
MNGTLNKVMLICFLGDDIKMHYFDGGNCIGRFQLATNEASIKLPMKRSLLQSGII